MAPPFTSFIACPSCGCHAKSHETDCPHCGARLRRSDGSLPKTAAALLLGLSAIGIPAAMSMSACGGETGGGSGGGSSASTGFDIATAYGVAETVSSVSSSGSGGGNGGGGGASGGGGMGGSMGIGGMAAAYGLPQTDNDKDGYFFPGDDCNDADANVHPGAPEKPGDGIDSNCNGDDNT